METQYDALTNSLQNAKTLSDVFQHEETLRLMKMSVSADMIFQHLINLPLSEFHTTPLSRAEAESISMTLSNFGASAAIAIVSAMLAGLVDPRVENGETMFHRLDTILKMSHTAKKRFNDAYSMLLDEVLYCLPLEEKIEELKACAESYMRIALSSDFLKIAKHISNKEIRHTRRALSMHQTSVGHKEFEQDHFWINLANQTGNDLLNPEAFSVALTICRWIEKGQKTYLLEDDLFESLEVQTDPDMETHPEHQAKIETLFGEHIALIKKISGEHSFRFTSKNMEAVSINPEVFDKLSDDSPEMVSLRESKRRVQQAVTDYISLDSFKIDLPEALKDDSFDPILVITPDHTMTFLASYEVKKRAPYNPRELWKGRRQFQRNIFYQEMLRQQYGNSLIKKGWIALTMDDTRVPRLDRMTHYCMNRERTNCTMHLGLGNCLTALNLMTCLQNPKTVAVWKDRPKKKKKKKKFTTISDKPRFHSIQVDPSVLAEIKPFTINATERKGGEKCQHERSATTANIWVTRKNLKHGETILGTRTNHAGNKVFQVTRPRKGATVNPHLSPRPRIPKITRVRTTSIDRV